MGEMPAGVQQLLRERAARAESTDLAVAVEAEPAEPNLPVPSASSELVAFQRTYYKLLTEPGVVTSIRKVLKGDNARDMKDVLLGLAGMLRDSQRGAPTGSGATKITLISKIERPPLPSIDVTPAKVTA